MKKTFTAVFLFLLLAAGCRKADHSAVSANKDVTPAQIINDFANMVAFANYNDLYNQANAFQLTAASFYANPNDIDLNALRTLWKSARQAWEQSEAFLFGPVVTDEMDPDTDTWPVNQADLDSLLNTNIIFTAGYLDSLQQSLKGYHPIEYIIFGANGIKTAAEFTQREKDYLLALANHLKTIVTKMKDTYDAGQPGNFTITLNTAGVGNATYPSRKSVLTEMANAMSGICDEVANGKINEVLLAQDPTLEESYFSKNSWTDFKFNLIGVKNVYTATYGGSTGKSLADFVSAKNLSLHNSIIQKMNNAINSFNNVTVPFGQAILMQPVQVQNTINAINDLKSTLEDNLTPFIYQYVNE